MQMHPTTDHQRKPPSEQPCSTEILDQITQLLSHLLQSTLSITTFTSRWQCLRSKLGTLKWVLSEISDSSHWAYNPLLGTLLPDLLSTLLHVEILCNQCSDPSFTPGKLIMQSDLDMASGWLSKQNSDLDLLLRSGVLHQSNAIVLSHPSANGPKEDLCFFVKDLFTRLQIGGLEFKRKALDSLIQLLSEDEKSGSVVAKEGNLNCLIHLLDPIYPDSVRELAVVAVSMLASASDMSRKCVFEEGALGPLLRIIECSSMPLKEKAAMAVEFITADPDNAWAISAYGGVSVLTELCKSGSVTAQSYSVGAIRNVCAVEYIRIALAEEGAIPVLVQLLVCGIPPAQEKAANCVAILASSGKFFHNFLLQEKGLQRLLHLLHESSSPDTIEHVLHSIYLLSDSQSSHLTLSGSTTFIIHIAELVKYGSIMLQKICASLLANLSISDGNKRAIGGCMGSLVKLMESVKPDGLQEVGSNALVSLLSVSSNRKEFVRDEKILMKLVNMLDPANDVISKKFPMAVVVALTAGSSHDCRKRLMTAGAYGHLQRLADMDVAGAKKALQRLSGNMLTNIFTRSWRE
ncbi:importin subunit alpha [Olea europaea subsp. europaea]|uniref:Importin subunit alpha n=1 Tax=Olea europaea subsp. europaea TaxID=158383 RepID=A0A8S0U3W4_OLEEU|nr:importin subunit alpha [Olea europaea subsp. europaea]